jgi:hypothetical protein
MKFNTQTAISIALLLGALPAVAQETEADAAQSGTVELEAIDIEDTRAPKPAYRGFIAEDSGLSVIDKESITGLEDGSGDALDTLRLMPNVNFDVNHSSADAEDLQDLRPADISISGGQIYDNSIRIDGVAVDNVMDVTNTNPANYNEVAGASAQTIFLDPSLIGSLEVRDSNISARYGEFSGGVVDAKVRDPSDKFGMTLRYGFENDQMAEYITDGSADLSDADAPPVYTRWRLHGTADLPVNDTFKILLGFGRSTAKVDYAASEGYGGMFRGLRSTSDNFLVKGIYDFSDVLKLTSSLIYSPYKSEYANQNGINNLITTKGGGITFKTELEGETGDLDWLVRASYVDADMSRDASPYNFSWSSKAPSIDYCTNSNCTSGGFGDLEQYQRDYTLEAEASHPLFGGKLNFGGEVGYVDAYKARKKDSRAYSRGEYDPNTVCADTSDIACIDGEIALPQYFAYLAYEANVEIIEGALWAEQHQSFGPIDVRAGARWSTDDYLDNSNFAPRISAVWNVTDDVQLTAGANRYYTRNFVGYAIREQYPDLYTYTRTPVIDGADLIYTPDNWTLSRRSVLTGYRDAGLDTPYSDEATMALTFPAFQALHGIGRLKAVQRWHRDQIVSLPRAQILETNEDGSTYTRTIMKPSNEGKTDYVGLSAEWSGTWRNSAITLNAAWSETYNNADDLGVYFDVYDAEDLTDDFVLYQGQIISVAELQNEGLRENFATPVTANAAIRSSWFEKALDTTLWLYWKGEYETLGDTGKNETVDGTRYDVFDKITRKSSLRVDLNAAYTIPEFERGRIQIEAKVSNLFNELPYTDVSTTTPYQRGRSIWLGLNWVY